MKSKEEVFLKEHGEYKWFSKWSSHEEENTEGTLVICKKDPDEEKKDNYKAEDKNNRDTHYFVKYDAAAKHTLETRIPCELPYVLTELGCFYDQDRYYSVTELYNGDLCDFRKKKTKLASLFETLDDREKERLLASIFLRMMYTVRAFLSVGLANLDIKEENVVYRVNDGGDVQFKLIDCFETLASSSFTNSPASILSIAGTHSWISPSLYYTALMKNEGKPVTDQAVLRSAEYCDIYSMGIMLYRLYSGEYVWYDYQKHDRRMKEECSKDHRQFYHDSPNRSSMLRELSEDELSIGADKACVVSLVHDMLSDPANCAYPTPLELCDSVIIRYRDMLLRCGLGDCESDRRFMLSEITGSLKADNDRTNLVFEFKYDMYSPDGTVSGWSEYRCFRVSDGDVFSVPFILYRTVGAGLPVAALADDILFIRYSGGKVCYRIMPGDVSPGRELTFSVDGEAGSPCFGTFGDSTITIRAYENKQLTLGVSVRRRRPRSDEA